MFNLKEKMAILESLNKTVFDYDKIPEYLTYTSVPELSKPILKKIFSKLVLLDTEISAAYDILPEDDWEALFSSYDTPLPESSVVLKQNIERLSVNFSKILAELGKNKIEDVLDILGPVFRNKTRNIQFVLFKIAELHWSHVFGYLLAKVRKDPRVFAPFYCSLLARLEIPGDAGVCAANGSFKRRCFAAYFKHFGSLTLSKNIECVVLAQNLLYVLCFNKDYFHESSDVKTAINRIFGAGLPRAMNRNVVDRFCDIFKYKHSASERSKYECLYSFPFDWPICKAVQNSIARSYVHFNK